MTDRLIRARPSTSAIRAESPDGFPPYTSRQAEIDAIVEFYRGVITAGRSAYLSAPITSGRRFIEWFASFQGSKDTNDSDYRSEHNDLVIRPNREAIRRTLQEVRGRLGRQVIDPTAVGDIRGWHQGDYRTAWASLIEAFVDTVVFADGWEFSNGCCFEFLIAQRHGISTVNSNLDPIDLRQAIVALKEAILELQENGLTVDFAGAVLHELEGLATWPVTSGQLLLSPTRSSFKDEVLDELARQGNVAQFVSFDPQLLIRHSRIEAWQPNAPFPSIDNALDALLSASPEHRINIRSYRPDSPKSREFVYGLSTVEEVVANLKRLAGEGLYTIANETIDVNDGGVSGVALGGIIEFAPGDTPRAVEKPGVCRLPRDFGMALLKRVYGFVPTLPGEHLRTEFSVHPLPRGYQCSRTILWEVEDGLQGCPSLIGPWPNRFSQFLGDKVYGLLIADVAGLLVPNTTVVSRRVAPFSFGRTTGNGEIWIRTCPVVPIPGRFTTRRGWVDPFKLLEDEDPDGTSIVSILSQEGVRAQFSGAAMTATRGPSLVEGVKGLGDGFMVGQRAPEPLPPDVIRAVDKVLEKIHSALGHPGKIEWAFDGEQVWVLQLHYTEAAASQTVIVTGDASRYKRFDVRQGLEALRLLVQEVSESGEGIVLEGSVGVTSHFGDVLRKANVPSRLS